MTKRDTDLYMTSLNESHSISANCTSSKKL